MSDKKRETRYRNWVSIVYPESAPSNWLDIARDLHCQGFVSPLHCDDITATGEPKKAHYHVLLMFSSVKTEKQAQDIFDTFNSGVKCLECKDLRGMARYFCHLDDYNKAQYQPSDVVCLGGADYLDVISSSADKYKSVRDMLRFIRENGITSYSDLLDYCADNNDAWFHALCDNSTIVIKEYLKSRSWSFQQKELAKRGSFSSDMADITEEAIDKLNNNLKD